MLFQVLLLLAVIAGAVAVALGRVPGGMGPATTSTPYRPLPDSPLRPEDVGDVRFSLAFRGYRMSEVDSALARLRDELADRDALIRQLEHVRAQAAHPPQTGDEPGQAL